IAIPTALLHQFRSEKILSAPRELEIQPDKPFFLGAFQVLHNDACFPTCPSPEEYFAAIRRPQRLNIVPDGGGNQGKGAVAFRRNQPDARRHPERRSVHTDGDHSLIRGKRWKEQTALGRSNFARDLSRAVHPDKLPQGWRS